MRIGRCEGESCSIDRLIGVPVLRLVGRVSGILMVPELGFMWGLRSAVTSKPMGLDIGLQTQVY